ncbi:unnamed protein product [Rotaria magnacalcarata]|uniref:Uncharacterized protein n=3 Tax=Rotaria magnacalcarata TaxID=392030 RepID=A0A815HMB7_9BILA|nr:unnamed protein product [Rotaria magnacalcarata]CAF4073155.1 unnamed protein product [Rotaria magnacalcarata]
MTTRLLNHCLSFPKLSLKRLNNIKSYINLGTEMKLLNDKKQFEKALAIFDHHGINNITTLSNFAITQVLKACAHTGDLQRGKIIHNLIASETKTDIYVSSTLIHMYVHCGDIASAQSLLDSTKNKTPPMYGIMMKGYIKNKQTNKAIDLFNEIQNPNDVHMILLFNACAQLKTKEALDLVKKTSEQIPKSFYSNPRLLTSLLDALMKCGDVAHAESLFYSSKQKILPMYGAMMKGYVDNNLPEKAIDLFNKIENPNDVNIILLFNACAQLKTKEALDLVKKTSEQIPKSFYSNPRLLTSLLDALMKCGDVAHAESLFYSSKQKILPMYGAMMKGYVDNNLPEKAIDLFNKIENPNDVNIILLFNACAQLKTKEALDLVKKTSEQIPKSFYSNPRLLTSLLDALMKCGDVARAESLFHSSKQKILPMYGAMMKGINHLNIYDKVELVVPTIHFVLSYVENNLAQKTIELFNELKNPADVNETLLNQMKLDDIQSSIPIYLSAIKAVSQIGDYSKAQSIAKQIPDSSLVENQIRGALIDLWGKVGSVVEAKLIFDKIRQPNIIEYTTMVNSYGLNGMGMQAIALFHQIPREFLHEATYVCALNACSHSGLVDEARLIFKNIEMKTMRIYSTMIDCFSRASAFEQAQELIDEYERNHSPESTMYS